MLVVFVKLCVSFLEWTCMHVILKCINVPSLFCSKGTQYSWSVPRGEDRGQLGQNGIPKEGVTRPAEVALKLVPQVGGPVH